jgi:hypothetical protein
VPADQQDAEAGAGLSEVAAYLASVPAPVMPGSVEARISAALAVEAAARSGIVAPAGGAAKGDGVTQPDEPVASDGAVGARVLGPAHARARVRRRGVSGRRREREISKIYKPGRPRDAREVLGKFVIGPLAVCLLVVIIALGLSHVGSSSSSSSAAGGTLGLSAPRAAGAASSAPASGNGVGKSSAGSGAVAAPASSAAPASTAVVPAAGFVVSQTGTGYQRATLAQQARAQVLAAQARDLAPAAVPSASSSSSAASVSSGAFRTYAPSAQLRACVLAVTGGVPPEVVDRATYQGTPAYVIASKSHVWVVGLGCTATRPQVIASEPLAG